MAEMGKRNVVLPLLHRFMCLAIGSDTMKRCGLIEGGVALLEKVIDGF